MARYAIDPSGVLSPQPLTVVGTGAEPTGVAVAPDGAYLYVTDLGSVEVSQYSIEPENLTPLPTRPWPPGWIRSQSR